MEFTIRQLAELVIALTGSSSKMVFMPLPADDPLQRQPDISRARAYLNDWQPQVQLQQGLVKTPPHFAHLLSSS